ncbi:MAG TPA: ectoine/hydroxyectoine ABC transporter substrate-binding protein EhuB [Rhodocyclaceae bacterium]|nr:ectoine/hydroxyectoine ABC transporter substrate-binding protein EhuB [Rhodocyclaceae bacterium]HNH11672.1 ectoine/hydroxyectoine ABC transporter substrate-binding protein EhuB [Rhodocyclaceae bacterium]
MRRPRGFVHVLMLALSLTMLVLALLVAMSLMGRKVESGAERVLRGAPIRIGYAWEPPYAYRNEAGRVTGESPEVARVVLAQIGIRDAEWIQTEFGNLVTELRAGRFDMIASGMFVTPERSDRIAFSTPSACLEPALLVRRGNPLDLHSLQEIAAHYSARLAVLSGAVEASDAREAGIPDSRIVAFDDPGPAVAALRRGLVDGLALSGPTVQKLAEGAADLERAWPYRGPREISGCSAFGFRRDDATLRVRFDAALRDFLGSEPHRVLVSAFGMTDANLPQALRVRHAAGANR